MPRLIVNGETGESIPIPEGPFSDPERKKNYQRAYAQATRPDGESIVDELRRALGYMNAVRNGLKR